MDVNVTTIDVQELTIGGIAFNGALAAYAYAFLATCLLFVAAILSIAVNYHRWHIPHITPATAYIADTTHDTI